MSLPEIVHPAGELPSVVEGAADGPMVVDTYAGPVRVEWDADATVTALGHFAFFVEYLKLSGRLTRWWLTAPWFTRAATRRRFVT